MLTFTSHSNHGQLKTLSTHQVNDKIVIMEVPFDDGYQVVLFIPVFNLKPVVMWMLTLREERLFCSKLKNILHGSCKKWAKTRLWRVQVQLNLHSEKLLRRSIKVHGVGCFNWLSSTCQFKVACETLAKSKVSSSSAKQFQFN